MPSLRLPPNLVRLLKLEALLRHLFNLFVTCLISLIHLALIGTALALCLLAKLIASALAKLGVHQPQAWLDRHYSLNHQGL